MNNVSTKTFNYVNFICIYIKNTREQFAKKRDPERKQKELNNIFKEKWHRK